MLAGACLCRVGHIDLPFESANGFKRHDLPFGPVIGFSKPDASQPDSPATTGALCAAVFFCRREKSKPHAAHMVVDASAAVVKKTFRLRRVFLLQPLMPPSFYQERIYDKRYKSKTCQAASLL
jgi:hypothetical protein